MRIVIFGGGRQGWVIAKNLVERTEKPEVIIADLHTAGLPPLPNMRTVTADVLNAEQVADLVKDADAAVLAVPSKIAHAALRNLLLTGIPVADVCFTPDPPMDLDVIARESGSCCVVDVGVAPGLSHILVGAAYERFGGLDSVRIYVGGIPQEPGDTFKHAVYFNPQDLLAEYVRPARSRSKGKNLEPAPMDVPVQPYQDNELGKLEAFLSDGLRSLLDSYPDIPEMEERTLRWPGHIDAMRVLCDLGLLDDPSSLESVGRTLGKRYPADQFKDVLLMFVEARKGGKIASWRMIDRFNDEGLSAMSRTTGFTTAATAMLLARKQFTTPGVHPPERLGHNLALTETILADLKEHGVVVQELVATGR